MRLSCRKQTMFWGGMGLLLSIAAVGVAVMSQRMLSQVHAADNEAVLSRYLAGWFDNPIAKEAAAMDTYMGEFKADTDPQATYYALGQWYMNTEQTLIGKYPASTTDGVSGNNEIMRVYGGLQRQSASGTQYSGIEKNSLLSFWDVVYRDTEDGDVQSIRAEVIYPYGKSHSFGNEGVGANDSERYDWEVGKWYRMAIHSWRDEETGKTFVGQWFQDTSTGKWTLTTYFNTNLVDSYIDFRRGIAFFSENYATVHANSVRKSHYKNFYLKGNNTDVWYPLDKVALCVSFTDNDAHAIGTSEFG